MANCRDLGWQQRYTRFCGRIVVLSVLVLLLYPFLWVWTVIGTLWFSTARSCVSLLLYKGDFFLLPQKIELNTLFYPLVARGRTKMGLSDMATFQLLWAYMYCMCGCWKGTTL
jgi:hypothetical protein